MRFDVEKRRIGVRRRLAFVRVLIDEDELVRPYTNGRSRSANASTAVKITLLPPMPIASISSAAIVKPGLAARRRAASFRSSAIRSVIARGLRSASGPGTGPEESSHSAAPVRQMSAAVATQSLRREVRVRARARRASNNSRIDAPYSRRKAGGQIHRRVARTRVLTGCDPGARHADAPGARADRSAPHQPRARHGPPP